MSVLILARDMVAFPAALITGMEYTEAKEKGRAFLYSTARVVITSSIVWGLYKGQQCEAIRQYKFQVTDSASIDALFLFLNIAPVLIPETRFGIGLFAMLFGLFQLKVYTNERWDLRDAPTELALKGVSHFGYGFMWCAFYEEYNSQLEKHHAREKTYLYRAADWAAPYLAYAVTGQRG